MHLNRLAMLGCALAVATTGVQAAATFFTPVPYLQAGDNPQPVLAGPSYLEDFEDGLANTSGLSVSGGIASGRSPFADSVDADDGVIDGSGAQGQSWYSGGALTSVVFSFSATVLGALPTDLSIVFTDTGNRLDAGPLGFGTAFMEVFDGQGVSQGSFQFAFGDGTAFSATAEDRWLGARHAGGIGSVRVGFLESADWEVDHLYYAGVVPEPGTAALWLAGASALAAWRRRSR
jgi:PEP-CTERM motif